MRKMLFTMLIGFFVADPLRSAELLESFEENEQFWLVASWGDKASIKLSRQKATDGSQSLTVNFSAFDKAIGKGIVLERDLQGMGLKFSQISLDVINESKADISVAFAIDTDQYYESKPRPVRSNTQQNLVFDLNATDFKSNSTNWDYKTAVKLNEIPKRAIFIFYRPDLDQGSLFLDNIRIEKKHCDCAVSIGPIGQTYERTRENHKRPKELPLEIFLRRRR